MWRLRNVWDTVKTWVQSIFWVDTRQEDKSSPIPKNEATQQTLNEVASKPTTSNTNNQIQLTTLNDVANKTNINNKTSEITKPNEPVHLTTSTLPITDRIEVKANEETMNKEKEMEDETWQDTLHWLWDKVWDKLHSIWKRFSDAPDKMNISLYNAQQSADEKADKQRLAVGYDWENVKFLDFKWQWWGLNWFRNTYDTNKQKFDEYYDDYKNAEREIYNSNLDDNTKILQLQALTNEFYKNWKALLWTYDQDWYTDVKWIWLGKDWSLLWRRENDFSKEQLEELKNIDMSNWITDDMFENFLSVYEHNRELPQKHVRLDTWDSVLDELSEYSFTKESMDAIQNEESDMLFASVNEKLQSFERAGLLQWDELNRAGYNFSKVIEWNVSQFWQWMQTPMTLYKIVKDKDYNSLTESEKKILQYWPALEALEQHYMEALDTWDLASLDQGVEWWNITQSADNINWKTIQDFFYDSIADDAFKVLWVQEGLAYSAIDLLQLINNQVSYDYWNWKWSDLRQVWQKLQRGWWMAGFLFSEWAKLTTATAVYWLEHIFWDDNQLSDYMKADFTSWMMLATDESDFKHTIKQYGLMMLENAPEMVSEVYLMSKVTPWGVWWAVTAWKKMTRLEKIVQWIKKAWNYVNKENKIIKTLNKVWDKVSDTTASLTWWNKIKEWANNVIWKIWKATGYTKTKRWVEDAMNWLTDWIPTKYKWFFSLANQITKRAVGDQLQDSLASYYDTEAYSTPTLILSTWMTGLTEMLIPAIWSTQWWKRAWNIIRWRDVSLWTWTRAADVIWQLDKNSDMYKALVDRMGWSITYEWLRWISGQMWEIEKVLKVAYWELNADWKQAINNFSKQVFAEQLSNLWKIDWQSAYGRRVTQLLNNERANLADIVKYTLWINWTVEVWPFVSSIVFKWNGWRQTRLVMKEYDITLDNVTWWFRKKMSEWFTADDIETIADKTKYKDVMKDGKVNSDVFSYDEKTWKYFLTSDWASKMWLDVSEYTEAMKRADLRAVKAENSEEFLKEIMQKLWKEKWISDELIQQLSTSWTFDNISELIKKITCE